MRWKIPQWRCQLPLGTCGVCAPRRCDEHWPGKQHSSSEGWLCRWDAKLRKRWEKTRMARSSFLAVQPWWQGGHRQTSCRMAWSSELTCQAPLDEPMTRSVPCSPHCIAALWGCGWGGAKQRRAASGRSICLLFLWQRVATCFCSTQPLAGASRQSRRFARLKSIVCLPRCTISGFAC